MHRTILFIVLVAGFGTTGIVTADDASNPKPDRPKLTRPRWDDVEFYPLKAKAKKIEGRVTIEYSIDDKGKPFKGRLVSTDDQELVVGAAQMVKSLRYAIPQDWKQIEGPTYRYTLTIQFALRKKGKDCAHGELENDVIFVCADPRIL